MERRRRWQCVTSPLSPQAEDVEQRYLYGLYQNKWPNLVQWAHSLFVETRCGNLDMDSQGLPIQNEIDVVKNRQGGPP